jgi:tetratricopeptide (TPR) repeat protein
MFRLISLLLALAAVGSVAWKWTQVRPLEIGHTPLSESWVAPLKRAKVLSLRPVLVLPYGALQATPPSEEKTPSAQKVSQMKRSLSRFPDDIGLLSALGIELLRGMRTPEEALPYLEKTLVLDPGNGPLYFELVGAYLHSNLVERGVGFFESLLQSNPNVTALANQALADLKASSGSTKDALKHAQIAAASAPQSPSVYYLLGSIYRLMEDPRAEKVLARAHALRLSEDG